MNCPKCGSPRRTDDFQCRDCGLIFAKWEARQKRQTETAIPSSQPMRPAVAGNRELDEWAQYWSRVAVLMLVAGFLLPLRKHSMLAGDSFMAWPWQLAGLSRDPGIVAALATYSEGAYPGIWTLLPLITACLVSLAGRGTNQLRRGYAYCLTGLGALLLLLLVFVKENERLGLIFTPPTFGAGVVTVIAILSGALIAAANHASRIRIDQADAMKKLARWVGSGGAALALLVMLFMLGGDGPWKAWSMWCLYGLAMIYALLGAARLFGEAPDTDSIERLGKIGRWLVAWSLIAVIVAQSADREGFSLYVVQGGGGAVNTLFAAIKGFLIFLGSALVLTVGMAITLAGASPSNESTE